MLVNSVDESEKFIKSEERKSEIDDWKKQKRLLISRFQHESKKMHTSNIRENEMPELEMLQIEICISKFV